MKKRSAKPGKPLAVAKAPKTPQNPRLNIQTRKLLTQHYRAKYGVK